MVEILHYSKTFVVLEENFIKKTIERKVNNMVLVNIKCIYRLFPTRGEGGNGKRKV